VIRCIAAVIVVAACAPGPPSWGLGAIDHLVTPPDPPLVCPVAFVDPFAADRAACTFDAGARAEQTLGVAPDITPAIPIRHVIVMMKENRSFDHIFGGLHDVQPEVEPIPADFTNPGASGAVAPSHAPTTCIPLDPRHQSANMVRTVDGGKMDGFVANFADTTASDGHFALSYYEPSDLPFYYWLATTYALADRHFAPMQSGTYANRTFMMLGTNAGVVDTGIVFADPARDSIFRELIRAGFTWGAYSDGDLLSGTLDWQPGDPGTHRLQALLDELDAGTLPNVAFVDGFENIEDDHPVSDLQVGEAWAARIYDHATRSPQWQRLAIVWTYDEGGGFFDHVPPPEACRATPDSLYTTNGVRIPLVAISPWAKRGYVSHVVHDHLAITRLIETIFDLPALTARDANSDALLDLFDFSCGRDLSPPAGTPAPGSGGCPGGPVPQPPE
jgi:phospholipase C